MTIVAIFMVIIESNLDIAFYPESIFWCLPIIDL